MNPAKVVHGVHQIADCLTDVREPRERETLAHLVRVHTSSSPVVAFHSRSIWRGVPQRLEFLIDTPLAPSGTLNTDVRDPLALIRLDDPHVP